MPEETVKFVIKDNKVKVYTAMQAMGQGIETSYLQILSDKLQITPEQIEIVQGDSDIAQGVGSMGSRSLYIGGSAMLTGSEQIIDKVKKTNLREGEIESSISGLSLSKQFKNMIYISCNPESFLRDIVKLDREIVSIGIFDQFANTQHLEVIAFLK